MKTALTLFLPFAFLILLAFIHQSVTYAITMENGSYQIDSIINYYPVKTTPDTPTLQENVQASSQNRTVSGKNYTVTYGFDGIPINKYFALKNSNSEVSFGAITPGEALERSITLEIIPGSSKGFQLFMLENHALQDSQKKSSIPDTTCDKGNCTNTLTDVWESPLTYGFGFRCYGNNSSCSQSFDQEHFYRRVPSLDIGDTPQIFASQTGSYLSQLKVNYKVNVSGSQPQGIYQNKILLLATPLF